MPYQYDKNWGRCTYHDCKVIHAPRCDAFACQACCHKHHSEWSISHRRPGDADGNTGSATSDMRQLPVRYGGTDEKKEWDYENHPPKIGDMKELGEDYERVFVPLGNYKANKDWPVDYIA